MRTLHVAALVAAGVLLAGCAPAPAPQAAASASASAAPTIDGATADFLARHNLAGLSAAQIVDELDASEDDRTAGPAGSVRPHELLLTDASGAQVSLPMPADKFYLSVAPYVSQTHDCFNHNLATCRGELANQVVHVKVTDAAGTAVFDSDVTTFANGSAGVWLPRDLSGTITVSAQGKSATSPLRTGSGDPTCLTTLRLI